LQVKTSGFKDIRLKDLGLVQTAWFPFHFQNPAARGFGSPLGVWNFRVGSVIVLRVLETGVVSETLDHGESHRLLPTTTNV